MLKIAVTGGIGSGKTAVTDYLQNMGYTVIDTDRMAHEITAPGGKSIPYIREHFGDEFILPDGSLDRKKMRDLVYHEPEQMKVLEAGTTAVIVRDVADHIDACDRAGESVVFLAIPLLFEAGVDEEYDASWAVIADEDLRIRRVMERDHLTEDMVRRIMGRQVSDQVRREKATDIIENSTTLENLYKQIDILMEKYKISKKS